MSRLLEVKGLRIIVNRDHDTLPLCFVTEEPAETLMTPPTWDGDHFPVCVSEP